MAIKSFKPYTPSRRNMTVSAFDGVDKKAKPERSLLETIKKNGGRNSYGRITVRHHGGGNKRKYRIIDFRRDKLEMPAVVQRLEYDPNRSAFIALVKYEDGELRYMLAPYGLKPGDTVVSSAAAMTDGDAAVAVAAGVLLDSLKKAALGLCLFIYAVKRRNSHVSSRRGIRLERFDRHIALHSLQID